MKIILKPLTLPMVIYSIFVFVLQNKKGNLGPSFSLWTLDGGADES